MSSDLNPYEFLTIVTESAYGVPTATPVEGTDKISIRLAGPNRFTMRPKPTMRKIKGGAGWDSPGYAVSDQIACTGDLSLELCYSQAAILFGWASTRISAGTAPWTTSEPNGDLASCTVYHATMRSDGTFRKRWYPGTKVTNWSLPSNSKDGISLLKLGLRSKGPGADPTSLAPTPADTVFPVDAMLFTQCSGAALVAGSNLAFLDGLNIEVTNSLDAKFFNNPTLVMDRLRGRQIKVSANLLYSASPEWRTLYEAITSESAGITWTNTTNTIAIDFKGNNLIDGVDDDLSEGKVYMQTVNLEGQWDPATSADIAVTVT